MKIRLYFDEDSMRRSLLRALRARGVNVITALDAEMIERKVRSILITQLNKVAYCALLMQAIFIDYIPIT